MPWAYPTRKIVLDPGHGGSDPGAVYGEGTPHKVHESDLVLDFSTRLFDRLKNHITNSTFRTRYDDVRTALGTRVNLANDHWMPDIFLSLHMNASTSPRPSGIWLIYDDDEGDRQEKSKKLAAALAQGFQRMGYHVPAIVPDNTSWVGNRELTVISNTNMPAVLIELGFITNDEDRNIMQNPGKYQGYINAIELGVDNYFTWLADQETPTPYTYDLDGMTTVGDLQIHLADIDDRLKKLEGIANDLRPS